MDFYINRASAVPIHVQIKDQIRYAIASGVFAPGDALPSIRQMTKDLGIHRNTIHRVYLELQAGGVVVSKPGKGVFVASGVNRFLPVVEIARVDELLEEAFDRAKRLGLNPITLAKLMRQKALEYDQRYPTFAFVECNEVQATELSQQISESWNVAVQALLLHDVLEKKKDALPSHVRALITSYFHFDELRRFVEELPESEVTVHSVTYDLHPASGEKLREIDRERRLGFICHDANTEEIMAQKVLEEVGGVLDVRTASQEEGSRALEVIAECEVLAVTNAALQFVLGKSRPEQEIIEVHFALSLRSLENLKNRLVPVL